MFLYIEYQGTNPRVAPVTLHISIRKGIFGIRELIKIRCGIRKIAKYFDGKRDSAAPLEAQFTNICAREAGFFAYMPGVRENISSIAANARSNRLAFSSVSYESKLQ